MSSEKVDIEVCLGPECRGHGGPELLSGLKQLGIDAERGHCRGLCIYMPVPILITVVSLKPLSRPLLQR